MKYLHTLNLVTVIILATLTFAQSQVRRLTQPEPFLPPSPKAKMERLGTVNAEPPKEAKVSTGLYVNTRKRPVSPWQTAEVK